MAGAPYEVARGQRGIFGGLPVEFTEEEKAAVQRHLDLVGLALKADQNDPQQEPLLHRSAMDCVVAQGLWYYAEELIKLPFRRAGATEQEALRKAAAALTKSLSILPAPLVM